MVKLTKYEVKLIAKNRGIKDYQSMSREKLLVVLNKSECITEHLSKYGLNKIIGMQNLSPNDLEQIERMNNLSENKLKQIAMTIHIKNYKDMSKEDLLIALLKSNQSHIELRKSEDNNTEIEETKKIFNELRNNFSKKEVKKIRRKFYLKKYFKEYFKKLEQKDSLIKQEKQKKERCAEALKKIEEYLKKLKEDLNKLKRYRYILFII